MVWVANQINYINIESDDGVKTFTFTMKLKLVMSR